MRLEVLPDLAATSDRQTLHTAIPSFKGLPSLSPCTPKYSQISLVVLSFLTTASPPVVDAIDLHKLAVLFSIRTKEKKL